jgi:hypothetical protein
MGGFLNAVTSRLLHNMRKRGLRGPRTEFAKITLANRSTISCFAHHTLQAIPLDNRIGQGDSSSMALYQYYNTGILKIPISPQEAVEAYVDDAILMATVKAFAEVHKILARMMTRCHDTNYFFFLYYTVLMLGM